jgi:hypothetical protein
MSELNSQPESESREQVNNRIVNEAVANWPKHLWALVRWCKKQRRTSRDLAYILGEGSTVAETIWRLFGEAEYPADALQTLPSAPTTEAYGKLVSAIQLHRAQKADDRCWMDDQVLYEALASDD